MYKTVIGRVLSFLPLLIMIASLSACSLFSPAKIDTQSQYEFARTPTTVPHRSHTSKTLLVLMPETYSVYDTDQIAYTMKPYQIGYFVKHHWIVSPNQMLLPLLVKTLKDTKHFKYVVTPPFIAPYQYVLRTKILKLRQNFRASPYVELEAQIMLLKGAAQKPVLTRVIKIEVPMSGCCPYAGVIATNEAVSLLLYKIAVEVVSHT